MKKILFFTLVIMAFPLIVSCGEQVTSGETNVTTTDAITTANIITTKEASRNATPVTAPVKAESCSLVENKGPNGEWIPVFCDEFSGTTVDRDNWNFETGASGWGNNEVQNYTNGANSRIEEGNLVITAQKDAQGNYTSSRMTTAGNFSFKYGRVDVRAKLPDTQGTWPAIWMMPSASRYGAWPNSGEVDIMEHTYNWGNVNKILGTIHSGKYYHGNNNQIGSGYYRPSTSFYVRDYHEYSIVWDEYSITWFIDNVEYFTTKNNNKLKAESNLDVNPSMYWPFDQEFFLILNIAVGGTMGGTIAEGFISDEMVVDYVRVYQQDYTGGTENPSNISGLECISSKSDSLYVNWNQATDDVRVKGYNVYVDGRYKGYIEQNAYRISGLNGNTEYTIGVEAVDYDGNVGEYATLSATTADYAYAMGIVQAENYLSMVGVSVESCSDTGGGKNIGYIDNADALVYKLKVQTSGTYKLAYRVSAASNAGQIAMSINDTRINTTTLPVTGGWQVWETVDSDTFTLKEGDVITVRLIALAGGFNLNWISFIKE